MVSGSITTVDLICAPLFFVSFYEVSLLYKRGGKVKGRAFWQRGQPPLHSRVGLDSTWVSQVSDTEEPMKKRFGGFLFPSRSFEEGSNEDGFLIAAFIWLYSSNPNI